MNRWSWRPAVGKKRTMALVRLSSAALARTSITEMTAEDAPTTLAEYRRAARTQKAMPTNDVPAVLTRRAVEFRYSGWCHRLARACAGLPVTPRTTEGNGALSGSQVTTTPRAATARLASTGPGWVGRRGGHHPPVHSSRRTTPPWSR
jgi:hypothetical protein